MLWLARVFAAWGAVGDAIARGPRTTSQLDQIDLLAGVTQNIDLPHALPGLAVASPSRSAPDYYYHWIRDGALAAGALVGALSDHAALAKTLDSYIQSSEKLQQTPNPSGSLGEPKFNTDGTAFTGPWGRPQNDGPALRAMAIIKYARNSTELGSLYSAVLRPDLEYVAGHWNDSCYDLWEELDGHHFFTNLMQWGALKAGAIVANATGNAAHSAHYSTTKDQVWQFIQDHYLHNTFVQEHYPHDLGNRSGLDIASVIAVLELADLASWTVVEDGQDLVVSVDNSAIQGTITALISDMQARYAVNRGKPGGVGRYPEDVYDGTGTSLGNPWFVCTASAAEALVRSGQAARAQAQFDFMAAHAGDTLSEQINRDTGYMQGAANLTWSYSSVRRARLAANL